MIKVLLSFPLLLALTACSTTGLPPASSPGNSSLGNHYMTWPQRQSQLSALTYWTAQGSIAAQNDRKGWNASYHWQQENSDYTLQLFGPLGMNRVQLSGNPDQVMLKTSQGSYSARSPEALLAQQLGWNLPVSNLYYWLRGLPAPYSRFKHSLNPNNHLVQLHQDGWHIIYLNYVSVQNIDLPEQILMTNSDWQVRMLINRWQVNA